MQYYCIVLYSLTFCAPIHSQACSGTSMEDRGGGTRPEQGSSGRPRPHPPPPMDARPADVRPVIPSLAARITGGRRPIGSTTASPVAAELGVQFNSRPEASPSASPDPAAGRASAEVPAERLRVLEVTEERTTVHSSANAYTPAAVLAGTLRRPASALRRPGTASKAAMALAAATSSFASLSGLGAGAAQAGGIVGMGSYPSLTGGYPGGPSSSSSTSSSAAALGGAGAGAAGGGGAHDLGQVSGAAFLNVLCGNDDVACQDMLVRDAIALSALADQLGAVTSSSASPSSLFSTASSGAGTAVSRLLYPSEDADQVVMIRQLSTGRQGALERVLTVLVQTSLLVLARLDDSAGAGAVGAGAGAEEEGEVLDPVISGQRRGADAGLFAAGGRAGVDGGGPSPFARTLRELATQTPGTASSVGAVLAAFQAALDLRSSIEKSCFDGSSGGNGQRGDAARGSAQSGAGARAVAGMSASLLASSPPSLASEAPALIAARLQDLTDQVRFLEAQVEGASSGGGRRAGDKGGAAGSGLDDALTLGDVAEQLEKVSQSHDLWLL